MDLQRDRLHEAGHFLLAYMYSPARAVSNCMSRTVQADARTGDEYMTIGRAVTLDPNDSNPFVLVSIRAAGLAAESIVYKESFDDLMGNAEVRFRIRTDTDNATRDLKTAGFPVTSEEEFVSHRWRTGFNTAVTMMESFQEELNRIADYCRENLDREILGAELATNCDLYRCHPTLASRASP